MEASHPGIGGWVKYSSTPWFFLVKRSVRSDDVVAVACCSGSNIQEMSTRQAMVFMASCARHRRDVHARLADG